MRFLPHDAAKMGGYFYSSAFKGKNSKVFLLINNNCVIITMLENL